jgi:hypothetical protein
MIYTHYQNDKKLWHWYASQILRSWNKPAKTSKSIPPILQNLRDELSVMDQKILFAILLKDRATLERRYSWIAEYGKLCDFVAYYPLLEEQTKKTHSYQPLRKKYLAQYKGHYLNALISKISLSEKELIRNWTNFGRLKREAKQCLTEANLLISKYLDYSMMSQETRYELFRKMDVTVCPYCTRQYIHTASLTDNGPYLGDLDHFYPQSYYPLFSLSLWNLIPVCKPCNQLFKRQYNRKLLSPQSAGFDDDCILEISARDTKALLGFNGRFDIHWNIPSYVPVDKADKIRENLKLFHLNDVYQYHKPDIQRLLQKHYLYSKSYFQKVNKLLMRLPLSEEEKNYLLYGTSLNKDQFHKELLGKMTYDIIMR